jgi:hypothetical protein
MTFTVRIQASKANPPDEVAVVAVYEGHKLLEGKTRLLNPCQYVDILLEEGQSISVRKCVSPY